mmetsp:Transcript_14369/g.24710  ORF Transcript_14369/g.24710 Transcript_14369/m.24710 type:complete len:644 (+) Transcript_14369:312-2243(+)
MAHAEEVDDSVSKRVTSFSHKNGAHLTFTNINVEVEAKIPQMMGLIQKKTGTMKTLLDKVSGFVEPGTVTFIMGASGSGKSTLLDALSNRLGLPFTGNVYMDHRPVDWYKLKEIARYVQQDDSLYASLTVFEVLMFCARVCYSEGHGELVARVEDIMKILGLTEQRNVKVGGLFFRGLSGGQKRRLSVACELIAQPRMLFLDEPTTGLDAAAAFYIVKSLRQIAVQYGVTVLATIHAPSEMVFEMADKLLLLSAGKVAYFGDVSFARQHMLDAGLEPPKDTATAEWLLNLTNADFGGESVHTVERVLKHWETSQAKQHLDESLLNLSVTQSQVASQQAEQDAQRSTQAKAASKLRIDVKYNVSWWRQFTALTWRGFLTTLRDPAFVWLRFGMYMMLGLMIGIVWLQLGDSVNITRDLAGGIFYIMAFFVFMGVAVIPAYIDERHVLTRERANGYYSTSALTFSKIVVDLPFQFLLAIGPGSAAYWLIGMRSEAGKFFIYIGLLFLSLYASESLMLLIGTVVDHALLGLAFAASLYGTYMTIFGYLRNLRGLTWAWKWINWCCNWEYYGWIGMMTNEFRGRTFTGGDYWGQTLGDVQGQVFLEFYDIGGTEVWWCALALIGLCMVMRLMTSVFAHFKLTGKKRA